MSRRALWLLLPLAACGGADDAVPSGNSDGQPPADGARHGGATAAWFVESARDRGLDFVQRSGASAKLYMPEIMSGGAALFDGDGDGDLDAYLVQAGDVLAEPGAREPNRLYANDGGRFRDVTAQSGAGDRGYGNGVACGDADGDGRVDLYVTNLGANALLLNRGDLRFEASTDGAALDPAWGTSAAFFDADRDGDLDLFVCNYLAWRAENELPCVNPRGGPDYCSPLTYESPARDTFLRNTGTGRFVDETLAAGLGAVGTGLGVAVLDVGGDGWLDLFVANDAMPDRLWRNDGGRAFTDTASELGVAVDSDGLAKAGMGVAIADVDGDGAEDILVGNLTRESDSVYFSRGERFADVTRRVGLGLASKPFTRFGLGFVDFDRDGLLDLFQANGRVAKAPGRAPAEDAYAEPNQLFRGGADGRFESLEPRGGTVEPLVATGRGAAFGDVDDDGAVDILIVNRDGPAHLLINRSAPDARWVGFELRGPDGAPALHAAVELTAKDATGDRRVRRVARAAASYQSSNDPRVVIGLGPTATIADVRVVWLDGSVTELGSVEAGRYHVVARGE